MWIGWKSLIGTTTTSHATRWSRSNALPTILTRLVCLSYPWPIALLSGIAVPVRRELRLSNLSAAFVRRLDTEPYYAADPLYSLLGYSRLVMHSFGFQSAIDRGVTKGDLFFQRVGLHQTMLFTLFSPVQCSAWRQRHKFAQYFSINLRRRDSCVLPLTVISCSRRLQAHS